ncbi:MULTISPECIES: hypothetical protein [Bacillus]|uniref:hypothetical protein n=1 Tax=Bacillus TaxID=1386 RepID=UPI0020136B15|nr:hypothetical protein [Bacillus altitudinis]
MTDLERRLYRIIYNMSRFRKNPLMDDLKRKIGKDEPAIRKAIKNLVSRNELKWDKKRRNDSLNKREKPPKWTTNLT